MRILCVLMLCGVFIHGLPVYAHPDLLLQIEELSNQISKDPQNTELLIRRGDLYRRHGDWNAAEVDFQKVRELSPGDMSIDWYEGRLLVASGQYEAGIALLTRLLEQDDQHGGAYRVRAEARWRIQQPLQAARDYQFAINNSERPSPSLYRSLVLSLVAAGVVHTDEAIKAVNDGLDRFNGEITLLGLGVDLSLSQKNVPQAQRYWKRVPARLTALSQWQFRQAILYCVEGKEKVAEERLLIMANAKQSNASQRMGTLEPPMDIITGLVANTSVDECSSAAWEMLRNQQP